MTEQASGTRPRVWVLACGGWVALLWLLAITGVLLGEYLGAVCAVLLIPLPVGLIWRVRYGIADRKAGRKRGISGRDAWRYAMGTGVGSALTAQTNALRHGEVSEAYRRHGRIETKADAAEAQRRFGPSRKPSGVLARGLGGGFHPLAVIYCYPVRDAWWELRRG